MIHRENRLRLTIGYLFLKQYKMKFAAAILSLFVFCACSTAKKGYVFTSFREPANEGLRLLLSKDGYTWKDAGKIFLTPQIGSQKIMRDPSMVQGPDGTFHLVWTTAWRGDQGFGYASSKDLLNWSPQQFIPVMKHEPSTVNVWAPELFYDKAGKKFLIIWASTIPNRFPKGEEEELNNHRMYITETTDFKTFTPTRLFLDPGFSVIDAVIVEKNAENYVLVLKDNTRPNRNIHIATAKSPTGSYRAVSAPFSDKLTEGPTVVKMKDDWLIYFDSYGSKKYEAVRTRDFIHFEQVNHLISLPEGHKHGTIVPVTRKTLNRLTRKTSKQ